MSKESITKKTILTAQVLMVSLLGTSSSVLEDYSSKCTNQAAIEMPNTTNLHLIKYLNYQKLCQSQFASELMIFVSTPTNQEMALKLSAEIYKNVSEFRKYNIKPIIILEPTDYNGKHISLLELSQGIYNTHIYNMFKLVKDKGINNEQIGTIVLIPEINTPIWNYDGLKIKDVSKVFNQYASSIFDVYGYAKISLMLNNKSFNSNDTGWEYPSDANLLDYIKDINKKYIYSVGLQGFPMIGPRPNSRLNIFDPKEYLNSKNLIEIANYFNTKQIWINTGSFVQKYSLASRTQKISVTQLSDQVEKMSKILSDLKQSGFNVSVNYFLLNKLNRAEQTNWSLESLEHQNIFRKIVHINTKRNIKISIFDM